MAPALYQRGEENEGIQGFLLSDIKKECQRTRKLICVYCAKTRANLACCVQSCKKVYHLDCGLKENVSFEFIDPFPSFCSKHTKSLCRKTPKSDDNCGICFEKFRKTKEICDKFIFVPCCNHWFHRNCLQKFANTSGVFFKCPLCNDKDQCHEKLPKLGIFLSEKDTDWEFEDDAVGDLIELSKACESSECLLNATVSYEEFPWLWKICSTCGANAIHIACFKDQAADFVCRPCSGVLSKFKSSNFLNQPKSTATITEVSKESLEPPPSSSSHETLSNSFSGINQSYESPIKAFKRKRPQRLESSASEDSDMDESKVQPVMFRRSRKILSSESEDSDADDAEIMEFVTSMRLRRSKRKVVHNTK